MDTPIVIYGADWCKDTQMTKAHLDRLGVPYHYINIEEDQEAKAHAHDLVGGERIPVIVLEAQDSEVLEVPSMRELNEALERAGLRPLHHY
jgi:mycoredoxin